jgi:LysM repeat protein/ABC-type branched-subunit amino acid transport system substrate-binding protein
VIALVIITCCSFAQEKQVIDGREYYIHKVTQGATLYSISKIYNIAVDDIVKENPSLREGLKMDESLKIPIDKVLKEEKPVEKIIPDGFIKHVVIEGETLYAISKIYNIKVKDIIENNSEVINGLKVGMILGLPNFNEKESEELLVVVNEITKPNDKYIIHEVKLEETLYSLLGIYEVSSEQLFELNPSLNDGLKLGQKLKIPKQSTEVKENEIIRDIYTDLEMEFDSSVTVLSDSLIKQKVYNVALLLPFYLSMNDTLEVNRKGYDKEKIYKKSAIALQFYQGALLALDSLKKQGVAIRLYVEDTDNDTLKAMAFAENKDSIDYHLIIGPLYKSNFKIISTYAKENNISIVAPVPQSNKVLLGNEYVSKTSPSRHVQMEKIAEYVMTNYSSDENVFVVNTGKEHETKLLAAFLRKARNMEDTIGGEDSLRMVSFGKLTKDKIEQHLDSTIENIIVLPTVDPVYVYDFLTMLNSFSGDYRITVFGLDKWLGFSNLDSDFLHNLNIHIASSYFIDYDAIETKEVLKKYRSKYSSEPNKYGFAGFDIMYYYITVLDRYGVNLQAQLDKVNTTGVAYSFNFFKTGMESGFENQATYLLKYEDFKLIRVQ